MTPAILDLTTFKQVFDPLMEKAISSRIQKAPEFSNDLYIGYLLAYVKDIALAGGKRVRPYVSYLMYKTAGGEDEGVLEILVAIELFHVFALIHDDIIDKAAVRHGIPTLHEYARSLEGTNNTASAQSQAILVGDLVFNWSKEILTETLSTSVAKKCMSVFDAMVYAVVIGQMLDVKIAGQEKTTLEEIEKKTLLKTAQYTFIYPLRFGAALAGMSGQHDEWSTVFGSALGMAFQLQDDLLDIVGSESVTGKKSLKDVSEGQHTIFTNYVMTHGSAEDIQALLRCFGKECGEQNTGLVKEIFERTGAISYGRSRIAKELQEAASALESQHFSPSLTRAWSELLSRMAGRTT